MKLDKLLEDNKSTYSSKEYKFVSELIWGGVPVDRKWAEETAIFKDQAPKLLAQYPKLDISFFEQYSLDEDDRISSYFQSDEFKESFQKEVEADTWDKGRPKVYMNAEGQIVKHWKDGKIEVVKDKKSSTA